MDDMHKYLQGEQLEGALFAWIKGELQHLIVEGLQSENIEYTNFEELVRYAVQCKNMCAFDVFMAHAHKNFSEPKYNTIVQSAIWDSVVHNVPHVWEQFSSWHPPRKSVNEWRSDLFKHAVKHDNFAFLEILQPDIEITQDVLLSSVHHCVEEEQTSMLAYLLKNSPSEWANSCVLGVCRMFLYSPNPQTLWDIAFEYVSLAEAMEIVGTNNKQVMECNKVYETQLAEKQKQIIIDTLTETPRSSHNRKI